MHLILTLAAGLSAALLFGYFTHRLGWSPIVGYLLAGVLVGPYTPGFIADKELADQLAEIGVILLMFGVGLHFHLKDLLAVRRVVVTGAFLTSVVTASLGSLLAAGLGWTWPQAIVFGLALSVSSTVVLTRVLSDSGVLHSPTGRIAVGWLVVEDIFAVFVLVMLPVVFTPSSQGLAVSFGLAAAKVAAFILFTLLAGARAIPRLLTKVAESNSRELFTLTVLAIALGIAFGAASLFGVSMALGAFLAGMVVGQSEFSARAAAEALPMRDAFAVMFFLSVGMLLDPMAAIRSPLLLAGTIAIVMLAKPLLALGMILLLGQTPKVAVGAALALAQIGEFSFLVAALGRTMGVLPEQGMNALVAASILAIMANPMIYRLAPRIWPRLKSHAAPEPIEESAANPAHRAVVVGHGPIGRAVTRLLRERGIEPTIIEMNIDTHRFLTASGYRVVYGDANQEEVLNKAGIASAASFILSTSGSAGFLEAIRLARRLNPGIHIVSRADYLAQAGTLRQAGADEVFSGEGEVALALTGSILQDLGATPDQLDEERARIRAELFEESSKGGK